MKPVRTFSVVPSLPPALEWLRPLAYNLWWAWNHDAIDLFRRLDQRLWDSSGHNPAAMHGAVAQAVLEAAACADGSSATSKPHGSFLVRRRSGGERWSTGEQP